MLDENNETGMLAPYRVLDLADEKGLLCGKLLGDLGADVIKVERPGGDTARNIGPFYHDEVHPEKSLFWFAYNASKRGITLNIETDEGKDIFRRLVKASDFIVESFQPGYLDELGLGYPALEKLNPGIIMVSITPFGQQGPYKHFKADDLTIWAMSGRMYSLGDSERPPIQISHIMQTYLQAGVEGAMSATLALYHRRMTGEGQHIDLSIQAASAQPGQMNWDQTQQVAPRRSTAQGRLSNPRINLTRAWPCKDGGLISWIYMPGTYDGGTRNLGLIQWMDSEGMATDFLKNFNWEDLDYQTADQELIDKLEEPTGRFFKSHTKSELLAGAVKYRVMFYPQFTTHDILNDVQLTARNFWSKVAHPELDTVIDYPGAFALASETPPTVRRRAPLIGEHNQEIYESVVGLSTGDITNLVRSGVI